MKQSRTTSRKSNPNANIAVISATWHSDIVVRARDAFLVEIAHLGQPTKTIELFEVPGALKFRCTRKPWRGLGNTKR